MHCPRATPSHNMPGNVTSDLPLKPDRAPAGDAGEVEQHGQRHAAGLERQRGAGRLPAGPLLLRRHLPHHGVGAGASPTPEPRCCPGYKPHDVAMLCCLPTTQSQPCASVVLWPLEETVQAARRHVAPCGAYRSCCALRPGCVGSASSPEIEALNSESVPCPVPAGVRVVAPAAAAGDPPSTRGAPRQRDHPDRQSAPAGRGRRSGGHSGGRIGRRGRPDHAAAAEPGAGERRGRAQVAAMVVPYLAAYAGFCDRRTLTTWFATSHLRLNYTHLQPSGPVIWAGRHCLAGVPSVHVLAALGSCGLCRAVGQR